MHFFQFIAVQTVLMSVVICFSFSNALSGEQNKSLESIISEMLVSTKADLIEFRRDLHRHPEMSGKEKRTAGVIAERLRSLGLEVQTGLGGYGVVGLLRGTKPGPVVAYRADMDAVPSDAPDPVPFASETPGVRHICGHDVHVSVAIGIAKVLASVREQLPGTVKFIFQPSEEDVEGAKAMISDDVLSDPEPSAIFAVHCAPLEVGQIGSREGMMLPGLDVVNVTLSGEGDLEAAADKCAQIISGVSTVGAMLHGDESAAEASKENTEADGFISADVFSSEHNPAENQWIVTGTVRASSDAHHSRARKSIEKGLAAMEIQGVSHELTYIDRAIPPVMNNPALVRRSNDVIRSVLGDEAIRIIKEPPPYFSEDFAFYQQRIPGVMFFLGVSNEAEGIFGLPHHPMFTVDEDAIAIGAKAMSMLLVDYLKTH
ncbi:MAG: amidohydrolase [Candidatus Latescibacteria bacterium]|nr:amidohydrolase [Candidatus Latescibacterota bacterium]NIM21463.1 amidohydrolase [Candidatus Latescibacterota bacterium]NIM65634.1 amidohydrolase [Candidatus Latescibacterota bacterium]NIO02016.1 amidohydrolase [Candidatus Latescibacterota bacterium]NIO28828.1 amidohydrolase [Candidatus Latescibacterota bacterium]